MVEDLDRLIAASRSSNVDVAFEQALKELLAISLTATTLQADTGKERF